MVSTHRQAKRSELASKAVKFKAGAGLKAALKRLIVIENLFSSKARS